MEYLIGALLLVIPMVTLGIVLQITKLYYLHISEVNVIYSSMTHYLSFGGVILIVGALVVAIIAIGYVKRNKTF